MLKKEDLVSGGARLNAENMCTWGFLVALVVATILMQETVFNGSPLNSELIFKERLCV